MGGVPYLEVAASRRAEDGAAQTSLLDQLDEVASRRWTRLRLRSPTRCSPARSPARIASASIEAVADGSVDLVIGTHALVQDAVTFADLSLAVVDEQHRFGLHQRTALKRKGGEADVLIMTATPIPRTLALTYYGDLDVVVLDELPKGRQPIATLTVRSAAQREAAYDLVRDEVAAGRQAFVVCAAIDEGNRTQSKAAETEAERLAAEVFPELRLELLHGRMRPKDKEAIMERFRAGEADLLISTTVIEVGVDVPNATVMLVENAERFGLAQLHQLRGRIGRGEYPEHVRAVRRVRRGEPRRPRAHRRHGPNDRRVRARRRGPAAARRGNPVRHEAVGHARSQARASRRGHAAGRSGPRYGRSPLIDDDPALERHPELLEELRHRFERSIDWLFRS